MTTIYKRVKMISVQKGNPHQLVVNQHVLPRQSLRQFAIDDFVRVRLVGQQESVGLKTNDKIFCANRAWDQRTEKLHSKEIEDGFAELAEKLLTRQIIEFDQSMNQVATDFYDLIDERYKVHLTPYEDVAFPGVSANDLTLDQQELLESKGVMFVGPDGKMSGRTIAGIHMMGRCMHRRRIDTPSWGVWLAQDGEFIVPDNFTDRLCLPIGPCMWLMGNRRSLTLNYRGVGQLNAFHMSRAHKYFFARDFSASPVYRRTVVGFVMTSDVGAGF